MKEGNKNQFDRPSDILLLFNKYLKIVFSLVIALILIFGYFLLLQPKINTIRTTKGDITQELVKKEEKLNKLLTELGDLEIKYNDIKNRRSQDLEKLYDVIPNNAEIADIFLIAKRLANDYGFQLLSIDIVEPSNKGNKKGAEEIKESDLKSLVIHMVVAQVNDLGNGYDAFKEYLNGLENNLRLMDIQTVSFEGFSDAENETYATFNFSIITYFNKQKDA